MGSCGCYFHPDCLLQLRLKNGLMFNVRSRMKRSCGAGPDVAKAAPLHGMPSAGAARIPDLSRAVVDAGLAGARAPGLDPFNNLLPHTASAQSMGISAAAAEPPKFGEFSTPAARKYDSLTSKLGSAMREIPRLSSIKLPARSPAEPSLAVQRTNGEMELHAATKHASPPRVSNPAASISGAGWQSEPFDSLAGPQALRPGLDRAASIGSPLKSSGSGGSSSLRLRIPPKPLTPAAAACFSTAQAAAQAAPLPTTPFAASGLANAGGFAPLASGLLSPPLLPGTSAGMTGGQMDDSSLLTQTNLKRSKCHIYCPAHYCQGCHMSGDSVKLFRCVGHRFHGNSPEAPAIFLRILTSIFIYFVKLIGTSQM